MRLQVPLLAALAVAVVWSLSAGGGSGSLSMRVNKEAPAWSPDGRKIALDAFRGGDMPTQIYVVNSVGSGLHRLTPPTCPPAWRPGCTYLSAGSPAWSPDSRKIVFKYGKDICLMNADGSGIHPLSNSDSQSWYSPAWSPDGKRIAFSSGALLFVVDVNGRHPRRVTPRGMVAMDPSWAPDGHAIVFTCPKGICLTRLDGSKPRLLTVAPSGSTPAWSPDGRSIAYTQAPASGPSAIYVMHPDGSKQRRLTPKTIYAGHPTWSPDSKQIAFSGYHGGNPAAEAIYVMNADGGNQHRLVP